MPIVRTSATSLFPVTPWISAVGPEQAWGSGCEAASSEKGTGCSCGKQAPEPCRGAVLAECLLKGVRSRGSNDLTVDSTDAGVALTFGWGVAAVTSALQPARAA